MYVCFLMPQLLLVMSNCLSYLHLCRHCFKDSML